MKYSIFFSSSSVLVAIFVASSAVMYDNVAYVIYQSDAMVLP